MTRILEIVAAAVIIAGCSGGGSKSGNPQPGPPGQVMLSVPAQNSICLTGTIVSETQGSVPFSWNASSNTDSYDLVVKNLLTSVSITQNTTKNALVLTLDRNTPYSWYVLSKSTKTNTTAQSDTWRFYNPGTGVVTYPPFPAEITAPTMGQIVSGTTINLTWTGSSLTGSPIANYDIYFGTTTTPSLLKSNVKESFVNGVTIAPNTTYYWKVISRNFADKTSDTGLYEFTVN